MDKKITTILISLLFILVSCTDCKSLEKSYRDDQCIIIVEKMPTQYENYFNVKGRNPITNEKCDCKSEFSYRWWSLYLDKLSIGDTIIKRRGELVFSIHKKDTILSFPWICEGQVYK